MSGMLDIERAARMCPVCGEDSYVYDTRETPEGKIVRRRRCSACGAQFETEETFIRFLPEKNKKIFENPRYRGQGSKYMRKWGWVEIPTPFFLLPGSVAKNGPS